MSVSLYSIVISLLTYVCLVWYEGQPLLLPNIFIFVDKTLRRFPIDIFVDN